MKRQTNNKSIIVKKGKFISLLKKGEWEYVKRSNCTSVVIILALTNKGKVIFTEQFRPPVNKQVIEFPAGLVNDGASRRKESELVAAKRELFEETGYRATKLKKILDGPVSGGLTSDTVSLVRAYGLKKLGDGGGDPTESIKVHEISLNSADRWLAQKRKKGYLVDPKVYAGLYFLKNN